MTFSFEHGLGDNIDEVLQEVKAAIFRIPQEPVDLIQPKWATQLSRALECYNLTVEEEDEDPQNIKIPETEGHHELQGPQIENLEIIASSKMKQVNFGAEAEPKFVNIVEFLCE